MKRILGTLAVLAVVAAPSLAAAGLDAPHDFSFATLACDNCHGLTDVSPSGKIDNTRGCLTCHNNPGRAFPWSTADQANPGVSGNHHNWQAIADNPAHGAAFPSSSTLAGKLVDGKLQCAVCHDAHRGAPGNAPNSRKVSLPVNVPQPPTGGGGAATMTIRTVGNSPMAFRVKVSSVGGFIVSHDYGLSAPSWFVWGGASWVAGLDNGTGRPIVANTDYTLDDGVTTVRFSAVPAAGVYWDFVVSFPFVRAAAGADEICMVCHASRVMTTSLIRGDDPFIKPNGKRLFSHPVGEVMTPGPDYRASILDVDGASSQTTGDGNAHNNLILNGSSTVLCTTCHAVHSADSNSLTP